MRVLVADDSAQARLVVQDVVEGLGHECIEAADGDDAWRLYQASQADVVISDWLMPGLEGPDLCRRIRANPVTPYTYVILLTVLDGDHALVGTQAGADEFLVKPLDLRALEASLTSAARVVALHRRLALRTSERERALARREALLRFTRRVAGDGDADRLLSELLTEAMTAVGGDGAAVYRRDEARGSLVSVRQAGRLDRGSAQGGESDDGEIGVAAAQAVEHRAAVIMNRYDAGHGSVEANPGSAGPTQAAAVPMLHEGRLLGALEVVASRPTGGFAAEDVEVLELLAGVGSAVLVGFEQARLEGVLLTARTLQHELNNRLAVTIGYAELVARNPELPERLRPLTARVSESAESAASILQRLLSVTQVRATEWGPALGPTIDLAEPREGDEVDGAQTT